MNHSISPSRTYVAMCNKSRFDGYYFRKFKLPESYKRRIYVELLGFQEEDVPLENNSGVASWYFLNHLNMIACIDGCISWEDFSNIEGESTREEKRAEVGRLMEGIREYEGKVGHEPGCDGNFNGGVSCSCSPYSD